MDHSLNLDKILGRRAGPARLSRRTFIATSAASAGGLVLSFHLPLATAQAGAAAQAPEINCWVRVLPDDTVVVRIARSEMGQGTLTGLAQLVAEELDCDWAKVSTEYPTPGQNLARQRIWGNFSTGGSRSIRESHEYVRKGGAAARMMLVQAAADGWGVPAAECRAAKGVITHGASGRTVRYGQVAEAAVKLKPPTEAALKDPKAWTIAGQPLPRLDTRAKTDGFRETSSTQNQRVTCVSRNDVHAAAPDCSEKGRAGLAKISQSFERGSARLHQ